MNREKKGIVIVSICFIVLFSMFLVQLPNEEIKQTNIDATVVYDKVIPTYAPYDHINNNVSSYVFINSTYGYGGSGGSDYYGTFIPTDNVSFSTSNTTFYLVGGGGGSSGSPRMITN